MSTRFSSGVTAPRLEAAAMDRRTFLSAAGAGLGVLAGGGTLLLGVIPAMAAPQVGQPAPTFAVADANGVMRNLSDMKGKIVVLEWTNADCPFVGKHYNSSNMQNLQREVTDAGAIWLSIISSAPGEQGHVSSEEANRLTTTRKAAPTAVVLDAQGSIGRSYQAQTTPHMYIIDANGALRYMGGIDSIASTQVADVTKAQPHFKEAFQAVRAGQPVKNAVTRPYGCTVKYSA